MKYKVRHTTKYTYSDPVPISQTQVRLVPREMPGQHCSHHRLIVTPAPTDRGRRVDYCGNSVDYFSITEPHRSLTVTAHSHVEVHPVPDTRPETSPPWETVARSMGHELSPEGLDACQFVFDSPRVAVSEALARFAQPSFEPDRPILDAARDLTTRIHETFTYDPKATSVRTELHTVLKHRRGVCQDFAHVEIGCLRSLGLAARYVSGYLRTEPPPGKPRLVGADASHAWVSIYCGQAGWISMDPTTNIEVASDHVTVAFGRDYSDVCPIQGVFVGGGEHRMSVAVDVRPEG